MFSQEVNGYNKNEVDEYITHMRANYESRLMEEKLKALDSEKKVLDFKNERLEIENKEKNIMTALDVIEKAKKFQEEGSRNFYSLIMEKLELLIKELSIKFPQLKRDEDFEDLMLEFSNMVEDYKENLNKPTDITNPIYSENDSMRLLLNKMQDYKKSPQPPKEVHISTTQKRDKSQEKIRTMPPKFETAIGQAAVNDSGFSLDEALHPTEDLAEIMKAFDFYNQK